MRQFPPILRWASEHNLGTYLKNKYSSFFSLNLKEGLQMLPGGPPWPAPHLRCTYSTKKRERIRNLILGSERLIFEKTFLIEFPRLAPQLLGQISIRRSLPLTNTNMQINMIISFFMRACNCQVPIKFRQKTQFDMF